MAVRLMKLYRVREARYRKDGEPKPASAYVVAGSAAEALQLFTSSHDDTGTYSVDLEDEELLLPLTEVAHA